MLRLLKESSGSFHFLPLFQTTFSFLAAYLDKSSMWREPIGEKKSVSMQLAATCLSWEGTGLQAASMVALACVNEWKNVFQRSIWYGLIWKA